MWNLAQALTFIQELQTELRADMGYHIALAGSVLNVGWSQHDLDLWMIPHHGAESNPLAVATWLFNRLGNYSSLRDSPDYGPDQGWQSNRQIRFDYLGKRVDVFIL